MDRLDIAAQLMGSMLARGTDAQVSAAGALAAADALLAAAAGPVSTDPSSPATPVDADVQSAIDDVNAKIQALLAKLQPQTGATPGVRTDVGDITSPMSEFAAVTPAVGENQAAHRQSLRFGGKQPAQRK